MFEMSQRVMLKDDPDILGTVTANRSFLFFVEWDDAEYGWYRAEQLLPWDDSE